MILHDSITNKRAINRFSTILLDFNKVHSSTYDYTNSVYISTDTKLTIQCKVHGNFEQTPKMHLRGQGCPECGLLKRSASITLPWSVVLLRCIQVHGDTYNYDGDSYINTTVNITIVCPIHGTFFQLPEIHFKGAGCNKCGTQRGARVVSLKYCTFVRRALLTHSSFYSYKKEDTLFKGYKDTVEITCPTHGVFTQLASSHLNGSGCQECKKDTLRNLRIHTLPEFIKRANETHGSTYDYSKVVYKGHMQKVEIGCKEHGSFWQTPNNHYAGQGCPMCTIYGGFKSNKPGMLYYFKITKGVNTAWKIGITNRSIHRRYQKEERKLMSKIVWTWYTNGKDAYNEEQRIIKEFKQYKYTGPKLLVDGNTELFNKDILLKES